MHPQVPLKVSALGRSCKIEFTFTGINRTIISAEYPSFIEHACLSQFVTQFDALRRTSIASFESVYLRVLYEYMYDFLPYYAQTFTALPALCSFLFVSHALAYLSRLWFILSITAGDYCMWHNGDCYKTRVFCVYLKSNLYLLMGIPHLYISNCDGDIIKSQVLFLIVTLPYSVCII